MDFFLYYKKKEIYTLTMACVKAVEAVQAHGTSKIQVETDSSQLREDLQSNVLDIEPSGILFMFLCEFLDVHFDRHIVSNVPWSCNSSAHEITKLSLAWESGQSRIWLDDFPISVMTVVARECAELLEMNIRP
jgi:hypothetical protein